MKQANDAARYAVAIMNAIVQEGGVGPECSDSFQAGDVINGLLVVLSMIGEATPADNDALVRLAGSFEKTLLNTMGSMRRQRLETGAGALEGFVSTER